MGRHNNMNQVMGGKLKLNNKISCFHYLTGFHFYSIEYLYRRCFLEDWPYVKIYVLFPVLPLNKSDSLLPINSIHVASHTNILNGYSHSFWRLKPRSEVILTDRHSDIKMGTNPFRGMDFLWHILFICNLLLTEYFQCWELLAISS